MVTVREGEETIVVGSYGGTVADVLASLNITLSDTDRISCHPDTTTYDGMTIEITRVHMEQLVYEEVVPPKTQIFEDPTLDSGEELLLSEGVDGLIRYTAQVTYENGVEVQRETLSQEVTCAV